MEIKRCARCGNFFSTDIEVCQNCVQKDTADVNKLKGFLLEELNEKTTKFDVAHSTGITMKNLNRYLNGEEFKGVKFPEPEVNKQESPLDATTNV